MRHRSSLLVLSLLLVALPATAGSPAFQPVSQASIVETFDASQGCGSALARELPAEPHWLGNAAPDGPMTSAFRCVSTTCKYDFICFETCAGGPPSQFCACVQTCIISC
ncbi:MAG: hypothetical protein AAF657_27520 [Acidobacteriota bacterium]